MTATASEVGIAKDKFRAWLQAHGCPDALLDETVNAAADLFAPLSFSEALKRREPVTFSRAHRKIAEFGAPGQWFHDDDLAIVIGCRVEAAGARRREMPSFGYVMEKKEVSDGVWVHRIVSSPPNR